MIKKMLPTREKEITLADVLDRLLDKGLFLKAELVITLGDIPLVGINLTALIAGMETMVQYGMMREFDGKKITKKPALPEEVLA